MKTQDLVSLLAADETVARPLTPRVLGQAGLALLVSASAGLAMLGIRADLTAALADPVTLMKWLLPLGVALPALYVALRLARPQLRAKRTQMLVIGVGAIALCWLLSAMAMAVPGTLWPQMRGGTAPICLISVTMIGLAPLVFGLRALKDGASVRPALSGAMLGLASGGFAAALYALHCNEDAPLFFLTWYSLGIIMLTLIGAAAGRVLLRW